MTAPVPEDEAERLSALREYGLLDTPPEEAYDDLVRLAAFICAAPIAAASLIDEHRQWFKAIVGLDAAETPREDAFCAHTILQRDLMVVPDATRDPRFSDNPLVTGDPGIRFYAGVPLVTEDGHAVGSLCVIDRVPRELSAEQRDALRVLAHQVTGQMERGRLAAQRRQAEETRRQSEARYREIVETAAEGVWMIDAENRTTFVNAHMAAMLGYRVDEMLGETLFAFMDQEGRALTERNLERRRRGIVEEHDFKFCRKDGSALWTILSARPVLDADGCYAGSLGMVTDVTARRQAEQAARLLERAVSSTGQGITLADASRPDHPLTYANPAFLAMTGYTEDEVLGRNCRFLQGPDTDPDAVRAIREDLAAGRDSRVTLCNARKDGTTFWNELIITPLRDSAGRITHFVGIQHDITALMDAEAAARANAARLNDAQRIAHLGSWEADLLTGERVFSPELCRIVGLDPADGPFTLEQVRACFHPDDLPLRDRLTAEMIATGEPREMDTRLAPTGAGVRWCRLNAQPLKDAEGRVVRIVGTALDITERKAAEASILDRERQLQLITDHVPVLIARVDTEWRYLFANRTFYERLQLPPDRVLGRTMDEVVGAEAMAVIRPRMARAQAGEAVSFETRVRYDTAGPFYVSGSYVPEFGPDGRVAGVIICSTDITARRSAQEMQTRLAAIVNSSDDAIISMALDGTITSWNPGAERVFGHSADEAVGRSLSALLLPPDRADEEGDLLSRIRRGESVQHFHTVRVRKDGARIDVSVTLSPIVDPSGTVVGASKIARDITERKASEREMARLLHDNQLLLASTGEGIYGVDMEGRCTFINRAASRMVGHAPEEAMGRNMHALIHHTRADGSHYPVAECPILRVLHEGTPCRVDTEWLWRRDGTSFPAEYASYPIKDGERLVGAVVTFSDISERVEREAQVREANLVLKVQKVQLEAANADLELLAATDPLTGLRNYRAFHQRLHDRARLGATAGAAGAATPFAVAVLDLDDFHFFNTVYGSAIGDMVLRQVADRLRQACDPGDTVARFGGDDFWVLFPTVSPAATPEEIEGRLREATADLFYRPAEGEAVPITLTVGAALGPAADAGDEDTEAGVVGRAEDRLRWAKTGGGVETEASRVRAAAERSLAGFSMLDALVTAVDNKDRYTRRHSEDVMTYSLLIARELGLSEQERRTLSVAALLHDVGKIGVPDHILRKPGRLTDDEFEAIKMHPMMGSVIVQAVPELDKTLDAVRHHHERWDGEGYPFGLRGEETPLSARLMAVADAFSAMTTDRPYRKGMERGRALSILREGAGTQWDPACVQAFLAAMSAPAADGAPRGAA